MRKLPPLNSVRVFEAAARNSSFSDAALELGVTTTAVSHQIRHLEKVFGIRLFDRTTRTVKLSPVGERLYPALRDAFDQIAEAFSEVRALDAVEAVSVSTTRAFAEHWLMPRLAGFRALHPGIVLNIEATERVVDLRRSGVDLAIRYGRIGDASLQTAVLFDDSYSVVHASSLSFSDPDSAPVDLVQHQLLGYRWKNRALGGPGWAEWLKLAGISDPSSFRINWFSEETLAIHAMKRGHGPLLCSDAFVAEELRTGRCRRLQGPVIPGLTYRLVHSPSGLRRRGVRDFADWIKQEAAAFEAA